MQQQWRQLVKVMQAAVAETAGQLQQHGGAQAQPQQLQMQRELSAPPEPAAGAASPGAAAAPEPAEEQPGPAAPAGGAPAEGAPPPLPQPQQAQQQQAHLSRLALMGALQQQMLAVQAAEKTQGQQLAQLSQVRLQPAVLCERRLAHTGDCSTETATDRQTDSHPHLPRFQGLSHSRPPPYPHLAGLRQRGGAGAAVLPGECGAAPAAQPSVEQPGRSLPPRRRRQLPLMQGCHLTGSE